MLWMLPTLAAAATLEVPTAYADLEAALDAAQIGDIVVLAAGPHSWSSDRTNLSVSLRGAGPLTQVQFTGSVDTSIVELTDLTLVEGGQVGVVTDSDVVLRDAVVEGDPLSVDGGRFEAVGLTQHGNQYAVVGLFGHPDELILDQVTSDGVFDLSVTGPCSIRRFTQGCATGSMPATISCDQLTIEQSVFSTIPQLVAYGDPLTLRDTTLVGTDLQLSAASSGVMERVLLVDAVLSGNATGVSYVGNVVWPGPSTVPGGIVADPLLPGPTTCEPADVASDGVDAGFATADDTDDDGDLSPWWLDCDDQDATRAPGAFEVPGDGVDQDCDGLERCFLDDDDGDGAGATPIDSPLLDCDGALATGPDCDPDDPQVYPGAVELCDGLDNDCGGAIDDGLSLLIFCEDLDGDGHGDPARTATACAPPPGYAASCGDCDDDDAAISPDALEVPSDGVDQDCDGQDLAFIGEDTDGDGWCNGVNGCEDAGDLPGDCDDRDPTINPGEDDGDYCDGVDHDCDGLPFTGFDLDLDGYPSCDVCDAPCDCNDASPLARPEAAGDPCDGLDNDCDGLVDEDTLIDIDGDGFGADPGGSCPGGAIDCDDGDPTVYPGAPEAGWSATGTGDTGPTGDTATPCVDRDCDGRCARDDDPATQDDDGDGFCEIGPVDPGTRFCSTADPAQQDCDDDNAARHPRDAGYLETAPDGVDNDCDGLIDEDVEVDRDGDGFPVPGDCNDFDPFVFPGADEGCDGLDTNCDGVIGDRERDDDGDGFPACSLVRFGVTRPGDCDDDDPTVYPYAPEICGDGVANDCDPSGLDGVEGVDGDGDGLGRCEGDCDDADATVGPGAPELCDLRDNDCNGITDEGFDLDADGALPDECATLLAFGYPYDCDDSNSLVRVGIAERCDGLDNNCDGYIDENAYADLDDDGYSLCEGDCDDYDDAIHPGAREVCDRVDHDCDGGPFSEKGLEAFDDDNDGQRTCEGDCDDGDAAVNTGGADSCEVPNGDCSESSYDGFDDLDSDGATTCTDCDDGDATTYPGATEICDDGADNDCDPDTPPCETDTADSTPTGVTGVTADTGDPTSSPTPTADTASPTAPTSPAPANPDAGLPRGWFCATGSTTPAGSWIGLLARRR